MPFKKHLKASAEESHLDHRLATIKEFQSALDDNLVKQLAAKNGTIAPTRTIEVGRDQAPKPGLVVSMDMMSSTSVAS